ncbi:DUF3352 domain-containing protein [Pedobacter gandavensis]|uniref:DUF3352 domain-containing protein n=1 Tax=Pedobacter gandavensis TaxID=2679963 RepID=A0ABR6F1A4_9SPHI|nr:DUF3352 domain-containing protein [Pedobacter gandavensis]MBB2151308.1 DUF3352 domain-containing protein [Pedobacter gandavensis]
MKKILLSIITLLTAIVTMAYLYFSKLNTAHAQSDLSLYAAVSESGFIFSFEQDKSVLDILKGQDNFEEIMGPEKFKSLQSLKNVVLSSTALSGLTQKQMVYLGILPGKGKELDFIISTQSDQEMSKTQLFHALKTAAMRVDSAGGQTKLTLADSSVFYLGLKDHLILLSNRPEPIKTILSKPIDKTDDQFVEYIKSGSKLSKNSLAQLYLNFNKIPALLKPIIPGKLNGELAIFNQQHAFALLTYNFSKERVLFTGTTLIQNPNSYYQLFAEEVPQKMSIQNILPEKTANFSIYAIDKYEPWSKKLDQWFTSHKEDQKRVKFAEAINQKYHLNLELLFPKYFQNQMMTFQLSTGEKLGAINLSNGDKLDQLLIDISEDYSEDLKLFKEPDLLYTYFGMPFQGFKRPYYTILDNYLVFANTAATLQSFLKDYRENQLLINTARFINVTNQLPNNSNLNFYIDHQNSKNIWAKNVYLPFFNRLTAENGLKNYESFVYQLSGDHGKFQTNLLIGKFVGTEKDF